MRARLIPVVLLILWGCLPLWANPPASFPPLPEKPAAAPAVHPGVKMAETLSATTGIAISPLFGMGALGAWQYAHTPAETRAALPWHAQPWFWVTALVIVGALALKEPVLYLLPGAKKPLDLLEVLENKASMLVAAPIILHLAESAFRQTSTVPTGVVAAGFDASPVALTVLGSIGMLCIFLCVWMAAHAVNLLILLSPSATLDMMLRAFRTSILGGVAVSAWLNPWLGLVVAILVIIIAIRLSGWSFRLMVYGSTVAWDFASGRRIKEPDAKGRLRAFLNRASGGLPRRSRGWLHLGPTGEVTFTGRPLPWRPTHAITIPAGDARIVETLTGPDLVVAQPMPAALLVLPPRYRGAEESIARALGISVGEPGTFARAWQSATGWLRVTLGSAPAPRGLEGTLEKT